MSRLILPPDFELAPRFVPLANIESFDGFTPDFVEALKHPDNEDIVREFPMAVEPFRKDTETAIRRFEASKELQVEGAREQFIIFSGKYAVGFCLISNTIVKTPRGIKPTSPNVSGYILQPFRDLGLGRFALEERMKIVEERFNGTAWTLVKRGNVPSEHNVQNSGFREIRKRVRGYRGYTLYAYGDATQPWFNLFQRKNR